LTILAQDPNLDEATLIEKFSAADPQMTLTKRELTKFILNYRDFLQKVQLEASREGISNQALATYIRESASLKNRETPQLYRWIMQDRLKELEARYEETKDPQLIWDYIDETVHSSRRYFKSNTPFQLILAEDNDPWNPNLTQKAFDARANRYVTLENGAVTRVESEPTIRALSIRTQRTMNCVRRGFMKFLGF
jgi:hypothetical protein